MPRERKTAGRQLQFKQSKPRWPKSEMEWLLLYFTDQTRPKGQRFLGVAIVEGTDVVTAAQRAYALGINPGGTVLCYDSMPHNPSFRNRLITDDDELGMLGFTRVAG